jgi:hypothetical protein
MNKLNGSISQAQGVRVADLRAYLLAKGWKVRPFNRPQVIYFEGPPADDGKPLILLIPASEQLRDYPLRIEEILNTLSVLEMRPLPELIRNIVTPTADILHLCLESPEVRTGTLELGSIGGVFSGMRDLVVFAACSQFEPRPVYPRALKRAVELADKCRFRPASNGSFQVDLEVPLTPPANQMQIQLGDYPIERLVLISLMQGLGQLQAAIDAGEAARFLASPPRAVSANLCEAILRMKPHSSDAAWEISSSWSPSWPVDLTSVPRSARFQDRSFEQISAIARALRVGKTQRRGLLRGKIVRLSGRDPLHGEAGPLSILLAVDMPEAPANVKVFLNQEQYREAASAHLNGQHVTIKGILDRVGRRWQLLDVSDFHVLTEAAP